MPGSTLSGSTSHGSSGGSRRGQTRHYYRIASKSQVDESLFGASGEPAGEQRRSRGGLGETILEKEAEERNMRRQSGGGRREGKRETVRVITKDLIRNLIVPSEDPSGETLVLRVNDFQRLKSAAMAPTEEERLAMMEKMKDMKDEAMTQAFERKTYMKTLDLSRRKNEKLNDLEEEEKMKGEALRQKAIEQLQEQEDEIKKLNELILNAKCHVIRDAQILEKGIIVKEYAQEEKRLDEMMEVDRMNALRIEEEIERKRKEERLIGAMKIMEQIEENEQDRLLDLERKDQENRTMKKYLDQLCEEEAEKLKLHRKEQERLREELNKCNTDIAQRKELTKEQERLLEAKVVEFQKEKAEREAAFEKEQQRIRVEKEKEIARLRALQERARDEQAERDGLRAKRAQEQNEREWRKKEAEEARRKTEMEAMLIEARTQQMKQKEHFLAVQAQRERADFERVLRAQQELIEKQKREEDEIVNKRTEFNKGIRSQIREKEQVRIAERSKFFEEGIKLDEEARQRKLKLEEVKQRKLQELRDAGIHEKYLAQIERKINQSQHITA